MDKLDTYRDKRDFRCTREPSAKSGQAADESANSKTPGGGEARRRFVIHHHAASHDHYDLRLEQDGVLRSWALPKGPSRRPGEKRLAVEVEDHPLDYADFEGVIPSGSYGAGTTLVWDRGEWLSEGEPGDGRLDIRLVGEKLRGRWTLTRMTGRKGDGRQWLMIKRRDENPEQAPLADDDPHSVLSGRTLEEVAEASDAADHETRPARHRVPDPATFERARRAAMPDGLEPQLATLADEAPQGDDWLHEIKFDGYRILARIKDGEVALLTRNGQDWCERFPELADTLASLPVYEALLDGEVVALASDGTSHFRRLQEALSRGRTASLVYQAFDLLHLDGYDLAEVSLEARKQALASLLEAAGHTGETRLRYSDHLEAQGPAFFERACRLGLEGIIAKRRSSPYASGARSKHWRKIKCGTDDSFVIGGYTEPAGQRQGFGALLLGRFDDAGRLVYAGRVGTGFSQQRLAELTKTLQGLTRRHSPFTATVPGERAVHWVRPTLVADVTYTEHTRDGLLRHPVFRGLREDRDAKEIRLPSAAPEPGRKSDRVAARTGKDDRIAGVALSHPERVMYPRAGLTKHDVAHYYARVADWLLPGLVDRPLSLLRCPSGIDGECFVQKHPGGAIDERVPRVTIDEQGGAEDYCYVSSLSDVIALVQAGTLEFHPWGCRIDDLERPDVMIFDLDPGPEVSWRVVLEVAEALRQRVAALDLTPFVRTTGGKGLHLVVPLTPSADWASVKAVARALCESLAKDEPRRLTTQSSKARRRGRVFLDFLRNDRGATAVASYSLRARPDAPVAVPIRWAELNAALRGDRYRADNLFRRLGALEDDPWQGFEAARRPLDRERWRRAGIDNPTEAS